MQEFSVLIALDGTKFAEESLLLLPFLKLIGATNVHLVSVWEDVEGGAPSYMQRMREASEKGSNLLTAYLESKVRDLTPVGMELEPVFATGDAAEQVLRVADETNSDLLVIATHGRAGIERWRLGSVADKVVRSASCPTLVIGPNVSVDLTNFTLNQIMVPLDGSEMADQVVPLAAALAKRTGASIDLVEVVSLPTTWMADPVFGVIDVATILDSLEEGATQHLQKIGPSGVAIKRTMLRSMIAGGIAATLLDHLRNNQAELVVMTSHGRHGVPRMALGSVTDELVRGPAPVLILRPGEEDLSQLIAGGEGPREA
jgi:nucleotide-binding universal stress UspA family protein